MAFNSANLVLMASGNGFNHWRYDTTDALTAVEVEGYIDNEDDAQNMKPGDKIEIVVWDTVRTGIPSDAGIAWVIEVNDGSVNITVDQLGGTFSSTA